MTSVITRIALVSLCAFSGISASSNQSIITKDNLYGLSKSFQVSHNDQQGFSVNGKPVKHEDLGQKLQGISSDSLKKLFAKNYSLEVRNEGADHTITTRQRLNGGGYWGMMAGCYGGKIIASLVCHGAIGLVGVGATLVGGPVAGWAAVTTLESTLGATIETTTTTMAIAGGIAGGVLTGPV